jgi:hypothetical protein
MGEATRVGITVRVLYPSIADVASRVVLPYSESEG